MKRFAGGGFPEARIRWVATILLWLIAWPALTFDMSKEWKVVYPATP